MSVVSASERAAIEQRAGHRCEYCHVLTRGQVAPFPIDHVHPVSGGGPTLLVNLALTCPGCNGHKWKHTDGVDPVTGEVCRLFNPRSDEWAEHFEWSTVEVGVLIGKTPCGRATINRLQINDPLQVTTRELLAQLGLFPGVLAAAPPTQPGEPG
jgi:hypothetical protein